MTRFLSESLGAKEPYFRQQLSEMERANGRPNADIRLSYEVNAAVRRKISELGFDPEDTTPEELYYALQQRLIADETHLVRHLRTLAATHVSAEGEVMDGLRYALKSADHNQKYFALKPAAFKKILKQSVPKKVMKVLGYRSLDSLIRRESAALVLTAALQVESQSWWRSYYSQYRSLTASDFELRPLGVFLADRKCWMRLSNDIVRARHQNILAFRELGSLVVLPLPDDLPEGGVMASLLYALRSLGEISSASSYLQICQVRADFGHKVQALINGEAVVETTLFDHAIPWQLIQRSVSRIAAIFDEGVLAPHIRADEIEARSARLLAKIDPTLQFWEDCEYLGLAKHGRVVSLNPLDVALNVCNTMPFHRPLAHFFQQSLWHELLLRYLNPTTVEETLRSAALATEPAYALNE